MGGQLIDNELSFTVGIVAVDPVALLVPVKPVLKRADDDADCDDADGRWNWFGCAE